MKKRKGYEVVIPPEKIARRERDECMECGKPRRDWPPNRINRMDWKCCSKKCTSGLWRDALHSHRALKRKAIKRDGYACVACKVKVTLYDSIADHITPIALGGEEFDIDNVQTLCITCDKAKTSGDLKMIAEARARERLEKKLARTGQTTLNATLK